MPADDRDPVERVKLVSAKAAGVCTAGVLIALALAPEALARISSNHNEVMLSRH